VAAFEGEEGVVTVEKEDESNERPPKKKVQGFSPMILILT
jgi:hypothetical protein